ncbi:Dam family site-specific DNA-(adenine-N6)-methyltransferase [Mucilaginibacter sp. ZT4R22]|uniref:site-specific DNA-methyltransferase (adenine-specific) n=1 Tax=Mucilaginibacter pankratovii TaxID=2772110 RepID=A0ABR7WZ53_9SPHI|nr:Dam family site-specific DNA-(adenine-N6)-methyltransferase [Mucilaginibacter pankratovii]MBD1367560.1 Dam family site-specific DNA-(adenine-N6)-methyltransferase [Mucilaginibacter pankratovii]
MKELELNIPSKAQPFLRWAGGKTWLTKYLSKVKGFNYNDYYEPFLGGAATFFYLTPKKKSYLSDLNAELIETYITIQINVDGVIEKLQHFKNEEIAYYEARDAIFTTDTEKAARFIYLNQHSFNGIHRVNSSGKYNVPYGFRKKNYINIENLKKASLALANTTILTGDFYSILDNLRPRDLVFLDPPYTVSHNNNGFIAYNEKIFSLNDQVRLSKMIDEIKSKGAFYILTNAAHKTIDEIFEKGDTKLELLRGSTIGGAKAKRGQTSEYIFTNIDI